MSLNHFLESSEYYGGYSPAAVRRTQSTNLSASVHGLDRSWTFVTRARPLIANEMYHSSVIVELRTLGAEVQTPSL